MLIVNSVSMLAGEAIRTATISIEIKIDRHYLFMYFIHRTKDKNQMLALSKTFYYTVKY